MFELFGSDIRLLAYLMRYSAMAIRDAVTLKRSCLVGNLITSTRTKTDEPFRVRIPMWLADELRALRSHDEHFFWNGVTLPTIIADRHRHPLNQAFKKAKVEMTSHRFRHYFISTTLAAGVSVEDVSAMGGTSPNEIRKTYRHRIKEATDRLDRVQEQVWITQGLDRHGNPRSSPLDLGLTAWHCCDAFGYPAEWPDRIFSSPMISCSRLCRASCSAFSITVWVTCVLSIRSAACISAISRRISSTRDVVCHLSIFHFLKYSPTFRRYT
jgi:hypothetical protein